MAIQLNQQQRDAVDRLHEFSHSRDMFAVLQGYSGTGKSTSITRFLNETDKTVVLTAPTNKATKVLRQMAAESGNTKVQCQTVHKLLGLKPKKNSEKMEFVPDGETNVFSFQVVVVDECSMVNESLMHHLRQAVMDFGTKVIFMGDPMQLPPVGEDSSPSFDVPLKLMLTKVERHDNQILRLTMDLRECIAESITPKFKTDKDDHGGVFVLNWRTMRNQMSKGYTSEAYQDKTDSFKTIAWRNKRVETFNEFIRGCIYGKDVPDEFQVGERVVACQPVVDLTELKEGNFSPLMTTDEEATIHRISKKSHPIFRSLMCWELDMDNDWGGNVAAWMVAEESRRDYTQLLQNLAAKARSRQGSWAAFWDLKEAIHDIRPCHAITAHRSQGSTYETAFVDVKDILANPNKTEAMRCLYVAASRASKIVCLQVR